MTIASFIHEVPIHRPPRDPEAPVGRCIYCDCTNQKLSKEHVIPEGLGGDFVLPSASCERCAAHIRQYEQPLILHRFRTLRSALSVYSRKKRAKNYQRPATYDAYPGSPKHLLPQDRIEVPIDPEMPYMAWLESTGHDPSVLTGKHYLPSSICVVSSMIVQNSEKMNDHTFVNYGAASIGNTSRFFAKIAYGFAVAKLGHGSFKPYILTYIRDHDEQSLPRYIGESPFSANENKSTLHRLELRVESCMAYLLQGFPPTNKLLVIVDVYLFWLKPLRIVVEEMAPA